MTRKRAQSQPQSQPEQGNKSPQPADVGQSGVDTVQRVAEQPAQTTSGVGAADSPAVPPTGDQTQSVQQQSGQIDQLVDRLEQQLTQAMEPILSTLLQQITQAAQQQLEPALEPVRASLQQQIDQVLQPVRESMRQEMDKTLEPMRETMQQEMDKVFQPVREIVLQQVDAVLRSSLHQPPQQPIDHGGTTPTYH